MTEPDDAGSISPPDEPDAVQDADAVPEVDPAEAAAAALRRATRSTPKANPRKAPVKAPSYSNDRDPQPIGRAVDDFIAAQGWQEESAVAALMGQWRDIVGADLADHVQPVSFHDGELALLAESTTWATQVRLLLAELHRAVDERVGAGVVTRITVQGPQGPSWTAGPRRVKGRGPRDTYG
jgi:predicted nucleic acid-binding Zn ribbon protein